MLKKSLNLIFVGLLLVAVSFIAASCNGDTDEGGGDNVNTAGLSSQTSKGGDVLVAVTPEVSEDKALSFRINLNSGSKTLNEDLVNSAVLVDDNGTEYKPVAFEEDSSSGKTRTGILKFDPITPFPKSVTLKLRGVGGVGERSYSWALESP